MKYCSKCLMPDTRPGITFVDNVCSPCINYAKQEGTDWDARRKELEAVCNKYRGCNRDYYDCAIAVSGGKDSHFQTYIMKEVMGMNPILLSIGNIDWTETGHRNLENLSDVFGCDIIQLNPNRRVARILAKKMFIELGSPTWYADALIYAFPYRMAMQLGLKLLVYGENVNFMYGGQYNFETPSAMLQPLNDVVKQIDWSTLTGDDQLTPKDLESARQPSTEECEKFGLEPIYLSYFVPWDSHHNYEVAKRWGFRQLVHEYVREARRQRKWPPAGYAQGSDQEKR